MKSNLAGEPQSVHHNTLEAVTPRMAKADLNPIENWRERVGAAVSRTFQLAGLSQKEAAAAMDRDPAQIARWIAGTERPQFDALFSVASLRPAAILALAELGGADVDVETTVRIRRRRTA